MKWCKLISVSSGERPKKMSSCSLVHSLSFQMSSVLGTTKYYVSCTHWIHWFFRELQEKHFFLCFLCWKFEYFRMFFVRIYFDFNFSFLFLSMRIVFFTYFRQNQKKIKRNWSPLNADHFRFLSELWKVSERFLLLNRCTYECKLKIFNGRSAHNIDIEFLNARVWWWTLCDDDNQIISHVVFVGRLCYTASRCRTYVIAAHTHTLNATQLYPTTRAVSYLCRLFVWSGGRYRGPAIHDMRACVWDGKLIVVCFVKSSPKKSTNECLSMCYVHHKWTDPFEIKPMRREIQNANKRKRSTFGNRSLVGKMAF